MLVDTSGLLAMIMSADQHHGAARDAFSNNTGMVTHSYILAELVALGNARRAPRNVVMGMSWDVLSHPDVEVVWVDGALHKRSLELLNSRPDKSYSLCDAASFIIMRDFGVQVALTSDRHFEQEGFTRLLK